MRYFLLPVIKIPHNEEKIDKTPLSHSVHNPTVMIVTS